MDVDCSPEDEACRQAMRQWLRDHPSGGRGSPTWVQGGNDWQRQADENGALGIGWPKKDGGDGSLTQQVIFNQEWVHARPLPVWAKWACGC